MQIAITILLVLVLLIGLVVGWFTYQQHKKGQVSAVSGDLATKEVLELQVQSLSKQLDDQRTQLSEIIREFKTTWDGSDRDKTEKLGGLIRQIDNFQKTLTQKEDDYKRNADVIRNQVTAVISDLAKLKEASNVVNKINDNVQTLQEVFINTKKRGNVGEYLLEKILTNMLGANQKLWERQYQTLDGKVVDAYVKTSGDREGIAIDSKFSFENYQKYLASEDNKIKETHLKSFRKDIRSRIDEVSKYISMKNHISSAIMFIPSEEIFAFIYAQFADDVVDYAFKKKVWITSPTTLAAVLFTVEKNVRDVEFNKNLEHISQRIIALKTDFDRWVDRWEGVKKGFNSTHKAISDLDITHNKLANHYQNILEFSHENKESE